MHVHFLDPYEPINSSLHQMDARLKLVLVVAFILTTSLLPPNSWPGYLLLLAALMSAELLSGLGILYYLKRALLATPFVLAALPILFTTQGLPLFHFQLGSWLITASWPGLLRFTSIAFKSWISVQAGILLAATTLFPDLLAAMRALRVPKLLVSIFGLMWRYLFVLADEVLRLLRARAARSSRSDRTDIKTGRSLAWRARITGGMAGNLFLRAFDRSDRIYAAMLSRGFDGEVRSLPLPDLTRRDWLVLSLLLGFFLLVLFYSMLFAL